MSNFYLIADCNEFSSIGFKYIATSNWTNIKQLSLSKNKIGTKGMSYLAKMNLRFLNTLDMGSCGIGL